MDLKKSGLYIIFIGPDGRFIFLSIGPDGLKKSGHYFFIRFFPSCCFPFSVRPFVQVIFYGPFPCLLSSFTAAGPDPFYIDLSRDGRFCPATIIFLRFRPYIFPLFNSFLSGVFRPLRPVLRGLFTPVRPTAGGLLSAFLRVF